MKKTILVMAIVLSTLPCRAEKCVYKATNGEKEKVELLSLGEGFEILQLRFQGPKSDEYYALQGHSKPDGLTKTFARFATRASRGEPLQLKADRARLIVKMVMGGNHYEWVPDSKTSFALECERPQSER